MCSIRKRCYFLLWVIGLVVLLSHAESVFAGDSVSARGPEPSMTPAIDTISSVKNAQSSLFSCTEAITRHKGLLDQAENLGKVNERYFGPLGWLLSGASAVSNFRDGNRIAARQTVAEAAGDTAICTAWPGVCPAWAAGRTLGQIISIGPKLLGLSDRGINDMWTDWLADVINSPTEAQLLQMYDKSLAKVRDIKAAANETEQHANQCSQAEKKLDNILSETIATVDQRFREAHQILDPNGVQGAQLQLRSELQDIQQRNEQTIQQNLQSALSNLQGTVNAPQQQLQNQRQQTRRTGTYEPPTQTVKTNNGGRQSLPPAPSSLSSRCGNGPAISEACSGW
jgi:hypothetical protein